MQRTHQAGSGPVPKVSMVPLAPQNSMVMAKLPPLNTQNAPLNIMNFSEPSSSNLCKYDAIVSPTVNNDLYLAKLWIDLFPS